MPFDRGNRTYYVSDERMRTFRTLPTEEKLRWVEELATFLRLAQPEPKGVRHDFQSRNAS